MAVVRVLASLVKGSLRREAPGWQRADDAISATQRGGRIAGTDNDSAKDRKQGRAVAGKGIFAGLPWWVTWVVVPVVVIVVFGGLIATALGFLIGVLFKVLIAAALIAGVIYLVRRASGASSSSSKSDW
ncbi:hypothetical protein TPA0598_02_04260 [Streptomyces lydicamycinicus]|uniref:Uncharacterized protein n=1 Tax=Streptomyces lydicamycinicus TaxID=1546107 RepID=A0A0N7YKX0_9ACTN|nr:hypothetical protein TPA0598_02_04260 [Streptomyces lydicamycinicus]